MARSRIQEVREELRERPWVPPFDHAGCGRRADRITGKPESGRPAVLGEGRLRLGVGDQRVGKATMRSSPISA